MTREELTEYIAQTYGACAEFPWKRYPRYMVFRHQDNRKWFAAILDVAKDKLGLPEKGMLDVVNLKCDPLTLGALLKTPGFFPGYHMNKNNWITAALDTSANDEKIKTLLDLSFTLTASKRKK